MYYKEEGRLCLSHYPAMGYAYHHKYTWARNLKEFDELNDFYFKSKDFTKPSYMINVTVPEVNEWENELFKLYGKDVILIEKLPKMSLGNGIIMQKNVTSYIDGLKICKFELETRP